MDFISIEFGVFFLAVILLFIFVKKKTPRNILLVITNLLFVGLGGGIASLITLITLCLYFYVAPLLINKFHKKFVFVLSIILSIIPLLVFKYLQYYLGLANIQNNVLISIGVPLGISFYTLQGISYISDSYHEKCSTQKNPIYVWVYLSLFSIVTSGPFESSENIFNQINKDYEYNEKTITHGLKTIVFGVFFKIFISQSLAYVVNTYYNNPGLNNISFWLLISTIFFAFELYSDFYGYSLIAKGSAEVLGIEVSDNFHQPYFSSSISTFWSRWHISFQRWLTKYIYIPLGGSRVSTPRVIVNVFIVFLVSGFWHGSSLTFLLWGAINGLFVVVEKLTGLNRKDKRGWKRVVGFLYTFIFITITWIFFRANTFADALTIFKQIFVAIPTDIAALIKGGVSIQAFIPQNINLLLRFFLSILGIIIITIVDIHERKHGSVVNSIDKWHFVGRYGFYIILICFAVGFGVWGGGNQFLYAQF